jgi:hypothetical protein
MKKPTVIYLQTESDPVTWCTEQINENDIEYILLERVDEIKETSDRCMAFSLMTLDLKDDINDIKEMLANIEDQDYIQVIESFMETSNTFDAMFRWLLQDNQREVETGFEIWKKLIKSERFSAAWKKQAKFYREGWAQDSPMASGNLPLDWRLFHESEKKNE